MFLTKLIDGKQEVLDCGLPPPHLETFNFKYNWMPGTAIVARSWVCTCSQPYAKRRKKNSSGAWPLKFPALPQFKAKGSPILKAGQKKEADIHWHVCNKMYPSGYPVSDHDLFNNKMTYAARDFHGDNIPP